MIAKFKAWVRTIVIEQARNEVAVLTEAHKKIVEDAIVKMFAEQMRLFTEHLEALLPETKQKAEDAHSETLAAFVEKIEKAVSDRLEAFDAEVKHTLENSRKDDPSHWTADPADVSSDHNLRHIMRKHGDRR